MIGYYPDQYERMKRSASKLNSIDDVFHFFQDCYHLKDWIMNDPIIKKYIKKLSVKGRKSLVEKHINNSKFLIYISAIANASKHLELDTNKERYKDLGEIGIQKPPTYEELEELQKKISHSVFALGYKYPFIVKISSRLGHNIDVPNLAIYAIKEWDKFIEKNKLNDPSGTYMKHYLKAKSERKSIK